MDLDEADEATRRRLARAAGLALDAGEYADVPAELHGAVRTICLGLPEATENPSWAGTQFRVRKRVFARFGHDVEGVHRASAGVPPEGSFACDLGVEANSFFEVGLFILPGEVFVFDPLEAVGRDFPVRLFHGGNLPGRTL